MIAYLILCHTDPPQLRRLVDALDQDAHFFIHVDAKAAQEPFLVGGWDRNVHFIPQRIRVCWGGFSIVQATLNLLAFALERGDYERLVLLNGVDYPIKPTAHILNELRAQPEKEFIRFFDVSAVGADEYKHKASGLHFYDDPRWLVNRYYDGRESLNQIFRKVRRPLLSPFVHCFGHMQWAISASLGRYILEFVHNNENFCRFYRLCFAPDEHFFHTIVANSPFSSKAGGPEAYVEYGTARMANLHHIHPSLNKTYTAADFDELAASDKLFTKKITSKDSADLITLIDKRLR